MKITTRGWPWQYYNDTEKYGWNPFAAKRLGRFGGGWAIKFGIVISRSFNDIVIDLIIGSIRIRW